MNVFHLNVGFQWGLATALDEVKAGVFLAVGNDATRFTRSARPELSRILIDPQLYLAGLDASQCGTACARLASHPWFCVDGVPAFDSNELSVRDWRSAMKAAVVDRWPQRAPEGDNIARACEEALRTQLAFGCTHIILPAPLLTERELEAEDLGVWLDAGLEAVDLLDIGQSVLATIALNDAVLTDTAFQDGGYLDGIVDQVTARQGLAGAYVVVAQTGPADHPWDSPENVWRAYARLTARLREAGLEIVFNNFADVFGLATMGVGATDFASGPSQTLRRLSFASFRDAGGGHAFPKYYSHRALVELLPESELEDLTRQRQLRRVLDVTVHSQPLIDALRTGSPVSAVAAWAESQNNLAAAQKHFLARLAIESRTVAKLGHLPDRAEHLANWLDDAEGRLIAMTRKIRTVPGRFAPAGRWLEFIESP